MMQVFNQLPRWLVWEIAIPLTILNGWLLYKVFLTFQTPFTILIMATLLAFLLNYPVEQLEKRGLGREVSIGLIVLGAIALVGSVSLMLIPVLLLQLGDLANRLPAWLESGSQQFQTLDTWLAAKRIPLDVTALVEQLAKLLPDELVQLPDQTLVIVLGIADRVVEVIVTAVFTLYFLLHGDAFWRGLLGWLPKDVSASVQLAFQEQFRNFFVGQATIALIMGVVLTGLFFLFKIPYWLVFGTGIGLLTLIPFGDTVGIVVAAIVVSFKSIALGGEVVAIAFLADQIIDQVLAPKILGNLVGLNPIWILIALLLGVQLGGFLGLILAVPLAGSLNRILANSPPVMAIKKEVEAAVSGAAH